MAGFALAETPISHSNALKWVSDAEMQEWCTAIFHIERKELKLEIFIVCQINLHKQQALCRESRPHFLFTLSPPPQQTTNSGCGLSSTGYNLLLVYICIQHFHVHPTEISLLGLFCCFCHATSHEDLSVGWNYPLLFSFVPYIFVWGLEPESS